MRVVSLIGSPAMKMADVRQLLLRAGGGSPLFNAQDALADSFFRMLEGKPSTLLLMVERADALPTELVRAVALCRHNITLAAPHKGSPSCSPAVTPGVATRRSAERACHAALEAGGRAAERPTTSSCMRRPKNSKIPYSPLAQTQGGKRSWRWGQADTRPPSSITGGYHDRQKACKKRQAELPVKIAIVLAPGGRRLAGSLSYLPCSMMAAGARPGIVPGTALPTRHRRSPECRRCGRGTGTQESDTGPGRGRRSPGIGNPMPPLPKKVESETVTTESTNYEGAG